jgi:hypothetical protein
MLAQKMSSCAIKADQQVYDEVDPGEGTLPGKAQTIALRIKQAFEFALALATVAGIGADVGPQSKLESDTPCNS